MASGNQVRTAHRTQPIEAVFGRLARSHVWHRTSISSYATGGLILFLTVYSLLVRTEIEPEQLEVNMRHFGNAGTAIERIREEHFIDIRELEELTQDESLDRYDRMAYEHYPLIVNDTYEQRLEDADDVPIGIYYTYSVSTYGDREVVHIEYWMYFSDEDTGMSTEERMARWGHPLDREIIYRLNLLNGEVFGATYQAPIHRLTRFQYPEGGRPIFRIASGNHNFQLVHQVDRQQIEDADDLLAPQPQYELAEPPRADPDIMSLAAREALLQDDVNMSHYVYVTIEDPTYVLRAPYPAEVDVGVRTQGSWTYLHSKIGHGVVVWGNRTVAIDVGFSPTEADIEAVQLSLSATGATDRSSLRIAQVFLHPELRFPA